MTEVPAVWLRSPTIVDDAVVPHYVSGRRIRLALARIDGRLYAFDDLCTCGQPSCPLSSGLLVGRTIMCQCHGSRFDITTGAVLDGPAVMPLRVYEVSEEDGGIQVGL